MWVSLGIHPRLDSCSSNADPHQLTPATTVTTITTEDIQGRLVEMSSKRYGRAKKFGLAWQLCFVSGRTRSLFAAVYRRPLSDPVGGGICATWSFIRNDFSSTPRSVLRLWLWNERNLPRITQSPAKSKFDRLPLWTTEAWTTAPSPSLPPTRGS